MDKDAGGAGWCGTARRCRRAEQRGKPTHPARRGGAALPSPCQTILRGLLCPAPREAAAGLQRPPPRQPLPRPPHPQRLRGGGGEQCCGGAMRGSSAHCLLLGSAEPAAPGSGRRSFWWRAEAATGSRGYRSSRWGQRVRVRCRQHRCACAGCGGRSLAAGAAPAAVPPAWHGWYPAAASASSPLPRRLRRVHPHASHRLFPSACGCSVLGTRVSPAGTVSPMHAPMCTPARRDRAGQGWGRGSFSGAHPSGPCLAGSLKPLPRHVPPSSGLWQKESGKGRK